jgi:hypothetical protein
MFMGYRQQSAPSHCCATPLLVLRPLLTTHANPTSRLTLPASISTPILPRFPYPTISRCLAIISYFSRRCLSLERSPSCEFILHPWHTGPLARVVSPQQLRRCTCSSGDSPCAASILSPHRCSRGCGLVPLQTQYCAFSLLSVFASSFLVFFFFFLLPDYCCVLGTFQLFLHLYPMIIILPSSTLELSRWLGCLFMLYCVFISVLVNTARRAVAQPSGRG